VLPFDLSIPLSYLDSLQVGMILINFVPDLKGNYGCLRTNLRYDKVEGSKGVGRGYPRDWCWGFWEVDDGIIDGQ